MSLVEEFNKRPTKRKALVVEDNVVNREMLCAILEDEFEVLQAENGIVGLQQLEDNCQDLSIVLLDVYMPECDGFEFLDRRRENEEFSKVPVIVTTASGSLEDERRCLTLGANDFVVKPYDSEVIKNRVNNMINLRESASMVNMLKWDSLTKLYSKEYFYRQVEETFLAYPDEEFDMMCCDIDNFKELNDRYGEQNCDELLAELARRLSSVIPDLVVAGRTAGDVFSFLMKHQHSEWESVLQGVIDGLGFANLGLKFGIVEYVDREERAPIICNKSITALETVKGRLGVEVAHFNEEMHERQVVQQIIYETMEIALREGQFIVYFQPKFDVRENRPGGAEALVRWIHPELGFVNPGVFINIFERNGFISKLDMFVWEEACRQIKRCQEEGLPVVPISVNVSRLDFDLPDLPERIIALADKYQIDHSLLHIELTETAYSDNPETVTSMLDQLKSCGFSIELDDFGAGYSSLASLNALPLDVMKLDMSMVRQATQLNDFRMVESALGIAKMLNMKTVVEGVETAEEARTVTDLGCDYIQGYYYSRPLSRADFEEYLTRFWTEG